MATMEETEQAILDAIHDLAQKALGQTGSTRTKSVLAAANAYKILVGGGDPVSISFGD